MITFYPGEELKKMMIEEAKKEGVSISRLCVKILNQHFGIKTNDANTLSKEALSEIIENVFCEVEIFANSSPAGTTFDLFSASETFKNIAQFVGKNGRPFPIRATIGKIFASRLKTYYKNIAIVRTKTGAAAKSVNGATLYKVL